MDGTDSEAAGAGQKIQTCGHNKKPSSNGNSACCLPIVSKAAQTHSEEEKHFLNMGKEAGPSAPL